MNIVDYIFTPWGATLLALLLTAGFMAVFIMWKKRRKK